jgi:hypothetical protein
MDAYKLNEEKMFSDITDGIAIVINSDTGIYYGMNKFGTSAFENLIKGVPAEKVLEAAKALPGAPDDLGANFTKFIDTLVEKGLVIAGEASAETASIDAKAAEEDKFEPAVTEYSDAQELLLADPIHDVKDETGWTPEASSLEDDKAKLAEKKKKESELSGGGK